MFGNGGAVSRCSVCAINWVYGTKLCSCGNETHTVYGEKVHTPEERVLLGEKVGEQGGAAERAFSQVEDWRLKELMDCDLDYERAVVAARRTNFEFDIAYFRSLVVSGCEATVAYEIVR